MTDPVSRTATCKRCKSTTVTWNRAAKGKWYLTEVFSYPKSKNDSNERTDYRDFHSTYCGKPELHAEKQFAILRELQEKEEDREQNAERREQERIEDEAAKLEAWYLMSQEEQDAKLVALEAEIERTLRGVTMDYMVDFMKSQARAAALRAEIDMYLSDEEE